MALSLALVVLIVFDAMTYHAHRVPQANAWVLRALILGLVILGVRVVVTRWRSPTRSN